MFSHVTSTNIKAGLAVAMINIPLCLSLSIASGAGPIPGLLTGAWLGIFMGFFGSSQHNIYSAAGSLAGILLPISLLFGRELLPIIGLLSAVCMFLMYVFKLTKYIALIPSSALHGFMLGIALLIISTQLTSVVGLHNLPATSGVIDLIQMIFANISQTNFIACGVFLLGLTFLRIWKKIIPGFPGAIVLTILGVGVGYLVQGGFIPVIQLLRDSYPTLTFHPVDFSWIARLHSGDRTSGKIIQVILASLGVAIIALLETLISAKIAAKLTKVPYVAQDEVRGLSIATLFTSILGGLPGAGVVVRTGMNIKNKADHRTAGLVTGVATLLISWFLFAGALAYLPFALIAAILVDLAIGMINIPLYKKIWNYHRSGVVIVVLVGLIAVLYDPLVAIGVGAAVGLLVYLQQIMQANNHITVWSGDDINHYELTNLDPQTIPEQSVVRVRGTSAINYLTSEGLAIFLMHVGHVDALILSLRSTVQIDMDGVEMLEDIIAHLDSVQTIVYFTGVRDVLRNVMNESSLLADHMEGHTYEDTTQVLKLLNR